MIPSYMILWWIKCNKSNFGTQFLKMLADFNTQIWLISQQAFLWTTNTACMYQVCCTVPLIGNLTNECERHANQFYGMCVYTLWVHVSTCMYSRTNKTQACERWSTQQGQSARSWAIHVCQSYWVNNNVVRRLYTSNETFAVSLTQQTQ